MAASPTEPLTLPCLAHRLPLRLHRRGALHFLRLFPRVFDLRAPLPLSLSLTAPTAELLAVATFAAYPTAVAAAATGSAPGPNSKAKQYATAYGSDQLVATRENRFVSLEIYYVHGTRPVLLEQTWEDGSARAILLAEKSKH
uniref:Uncharacterized protein n=1 Tax=Oryza glaberrima TaxID=4538 RepID=I1P724_ORYGL